MRGGAYLAGAFAETDPVAVTLRPAGQGQRVPVLDERARLAGVQLERFRASPGDFQERTVLVFLRSRDGAGAQQVTHVHAAAAHRMMRELLCG